MATLLMVVMKPDMNIFNNNKSSGNEELPPTWKQS